ncbi:carboxypeptidase-like regulatory domain-containing protein [Tenacibaculum sp. ZS6-P6]|uniref:carboxypeptidase-like regulatory domain-containing protein n=1 Tax=Tenacibaculum sp. ZS6-P6 TaxID=3447503 RepID=UPI003F9E5056
MKNKITLEIKKPCSQKFSEFTKTNSGGFCNSCNKEVIDFTGMSSKEIIQYFKKNSNQKTCGQFLNRQISSPFIEYQNNKTNHFLKSLGLTILSLFTYNNIEAQQIKTPTEITPIQIKTKGVNTKQPTFKVKGFVSDETGPLPGISIYLEGSTIGTETNIEGHFDFPKKLKKGDVLIFSFIGMDSKKIVIENQKYLTNLELNVKMESNNCLLLGEVTVKKVFTSKKKFWKRKLKE